MRTLYLLTDGFGVSGGIAQFTRDHLKAICAYPGTTEVVALPRNVGTETGILPNKLIYDASAARGKVRYALSVLKWLLNAPRFDVIICGHVNLQPLAIAAHWLSGAPVVLILYGIEAWKPSPSLIRRLAVKRAHWVAAVSRFTLDRFGTWAKFPSDHAVILPCCVDLERFTPGEPAPFVRQKYGLAGQLAVLTLGRLAATERYKGFDELLEVLARLRAVEPSLLYVIAGSGEDRSRLEAKARALDMADHVRFLGFVPDGELVDLYRAARVFVLAGQGEGFGIVLLEAMACGVPVVASTLDGSFEAIDRGKLGIAVDPTKPDDLAAGVLEALGRPVGERPAGIEYFSYRAFEARVHEFLGRLVRPEADPR